MGPKGRSFRAQRQWVVAKIRERWNNRTNVKEWPTRVYDFRTQFVWGMIRCVAEKEDICSCGSKEL